MKNKNLYILLPIVLIIWGVLIYRFVDSLNQNPAISGVQNSYIPTSHVDVWHEDSLVELKTLKEDPFLGIDYIEKPKKLKVVTSNQNKKEFVWPDIKYLGSISDTGNNQIIYSVKIDDQATLLEKGETYKEVKIFKSSQNKIWIKYKGRLKVFTKS